MSLAELQAELAAHMEARPVQPCPVSEMTSKQYSRWSRELAAWAETKDMLMGLIDSYGVRMEFKRQAPQCSPRADYIYREPMGRKRQRPPRPAWSGATPEYNRQKARESRERRRAAIREALDERKTA